MSSSSLEQRPQTTASGAVAILPARLGSTRLQEKVLLAETGRPLFVHAAQNVARCAGLARVVAVTDSDRVVEAGREHGVEAVMTRVDHPSGSDRVREALDGLSGDEPSVVLNVQADEPNVRTEDLERLIECFADETVQLATLATPNEEGSSRIRTLRPF